VTSGPTLVAASANATTSPTKNLTIPNPAWTGSASLPGAAVLVWCGASVGSGAGVSWATPGFLSVPAVASSSITAQLFYLLTTGAEGSTFAFSLSEGVNWGYAAAAYSGESQVIIFDPVPPASGVMSSSNSLTIANPGITTQYAGTQLAWFGMAHWAPASGAPTITQPASFTAQCAQANTNASEGVTEVSLLMADMPAAGTGATGAVNGSLDSTQMNGSLVIGIASASAVISSGLYVRPRRYSPRASRRGRQALPVLGQGNMGVSFPLATRTPGIRPHWLPQLRRGKVAMPPLPQGMQPVQFPLATRQGGTRPKFATQQLRRGRAFAPVPPQANQGAQFPLFTRASRGIQSQRDLLPRLRRGSVFMPPFPQSPQGAGFSLFTRQPALRSRWEPPARLLRGRSAAPRMQQAIRGQPYATVTRRPAGWLRFPPLVRRRRVFAIPFAAQMAQGRITGTGTGSGTAAALVTRVAMAAVTGSGSGTASAYTVRAAVAAGRAAGSGHIAASVTSPVHVHGTAQADGTAAATAAAHGTAAAQGHGSGSVQGIIVKQAVATARGAGSGTVTALITPAVPGGGVGSGVILATVTVLAAAAGSGAGSGSADAAAGAPPQEIIIEPQGQAPWEKVAETGAWQQRGPFQGPGTVTVEGLDDGVYDDGES
jgi:hypothetical protein